MVKKLLTIALRLGPNERRPPRKRKVTMKSRGPQRGKKNIFLDSREKKKDLQIPLSPGRKLGFKGEKEKFANGVREKGASGEIASEKVVLNPNPSSGKKKKKNKKRARIEKKEKVFTFLLFEQRKKGSYTA